MAKEVNKEQGKPVIEVFKEDIRARAGEIFKKRTADNKPGDELSDWLAAEKEIKKKYGI